jgi:hypothetical protein
MNIKIRLTCLIALIGCGSLALACGSDDDGGSGDGDGNNAGQGNNNAGNGNGNGGSGNGNGGSGNGNGGSGNNNGGNGNGNSCDPMTGQQQDDTCPDYTSCVETACDSNYKTCFGQNYKEGDFSGSPCEAYVECAQGCDCDTSCLLNCYNNASTECSNCFGSFTTCAGSCSDELNACAGGGLGGSGSGGTGNTGSGTCDDLQDCCDSLGSDQKPSCEALYNATKAGGDQACGAVYSTYKLTGLCD